MEYGLSFSAYSNDIFKLWYKWQILIWPNDIESIYSAYTKHVHVIVPVGIS